MPTVPQNPTPPPPVERVPSPAEARDIKEVKTTAARAQQNTYNLNARMRRLEKVCPLLNEHVAAAGGVERSSAAAPPPAPHSGGSRISVEGNDLVYRGAPIRIKGVGRWLKRGSLTLVVLVLLVWLVLLNMQTVRPIGYEPPVVTTTYRTPADYQALRRFYEAVCADETSWWNLTQAQRDIGEEVEHVPDTPASD